MGTTSEPSLTYTLSWFYSIGEGSGETHHILESKIYSFFFFFFLQLIRFLAARSKHQGVKKRLCPDSETIPIFKWIKEKRCKQLTGLRNLPKVALNYKLFKEDFINTLNNPLYPTEFLLKYWKHMGTPGVKNRQVPKATWLFWRPSASTVFKKGWLASWGLGWGQYRRGWGSLRKGCYTKHGSFPQSETRHVSECGLLLLWGNNSLQQNSPRPDQGGSGGRMGLRLGVQFQRQRKQNWILAPEMLQS